MIIKETPRKRMSLRLAAGTIALGALMASAPYTIAQQTPDTPDTPTVKKKMVDKKVMKWTTKEDGVETTKHVEIVTEDGVTTAWEIDELGNRKEVDPDSIDMPKHLGHHDQGNVRIRVQKMGDGEDMEFDVNQWVEAGEDGKHIIIKRMGEGGEMDIEIEELMGAAEGEGKVVVIEKHSAMDFMSDEDGKVIVKHMEGGPANAFFFSSDDMEAMHGPKADMWVNIASEMLGNVETDSLDKKARKKVEAAQKALKEAQEALEAAE